MIELHEPLGKLFASAALSFLLFGTGCHKDVSLTCLPQAPAIGGDALDNFGAVGTQGFGFVNTNGSAIGTVYQLDLTSSKDIFVNPEGLIAYTSSSPNDYVLNAPGNTTIGVAIAWQFDASAQSQLDSTQQAMIQAASQKTWKLSLQNVSQAILNNTLNLINNDVRNAQLKSEILASPKSIFMILNPALQGTSSEMSVSEADSAKVSSSIKIGFLISADVSYTCTSDFLRSSISSTSAQATLITYPELVKAASDGKSVIHASGLAFPASSKAVTVEVSSFPNGGTSGSVEKVPNYATVHFCRQADYDFVKQRCNPT